MSLEHEGAGRRREPTPSQAGRQEQKQTPQQRGERIRGIPPPGEQARPQQEGGEREPLADVRDILERKARKGRPTKRQRAMREAFSKIVEEPKKKNHRIRFVVDPRHTDVKLREQAQPEAVQIFPSTKPL